MWLLNRVTGQRNNSLIDWPYPFVQDEMFVLTLSTGLEVAGSLPIAYPSNVQRNLEFLTELKAPPLPEEPIELFIGILCAGSHFTERMAVRRSWMSSVRKSSITMAQFFVALNERKEVNKDLKKEVDFFGNIVIVPFADSYDMVVLKTVAICEYADWPSEAYPPYANGPRLYCFF
ncbi:hypothetical protein GUJ93_ZPchr0109g40564 [Zizania palustris]|uniref:Hexosyltransferase n=1 Tax=Zizania palustris TaxID=103762 RepID=A0A8J5RMP7_ZIZPA|nr:hypothetical protein GUJ93_ZPchr0109g40564 [Zizania palustris]